MCRIDPDIDEFPKDDCLDFLDDMKICYGLSRRRTEKGRVQKINKLKKVVPGLLVVWGVPKIVKSGKIICFFPFLANTTLKKQIICPLFTRGEEVPEK